MSPLSSRTGIAGRLAFGIALSAYLALLISRAALGVGGSDSAGYFNTARALENGTPVEDVPLFRELELGDDRIHLVLPLGSVPGPRPGTLAPFYPAGFPLHMLAAAKLFGWEWGPFIVAPVAGALSVLLIALLALELGLTPRAAVASAAMLAACPVFLFQGLQPMSDVPATLWALAAVLFAWKARRGWGWAAACGLAFGIAVLVRPTSVLLLPVLLIALPLRGRTLLAFAAGGIPPLAAVLSYNAACYGGPFRSGYGAGGSLSDFALANFPVRFRHYLRWLLEMMGVPLAGWTAFLAAGGPRFRERLLVGAWFLPFLLVYCFYGPYETWWYTRYLLPAIPALILGTLLLIERPSVAHAS